MIIYGIMLFFVLILITTLLIYSTYSTYSIPKFSHHQQHQGSCNIHTCGAIDPVSNPEYNMKEIITQCILLEEHLTIDNKFCLDCCVKHILHCYGLANEAVMLAGNKINQYPMMKEAPLFFISIYNDFMENVYHHQNKQRRLDIATKLRHYRKKLVQIYILNKNKDKQ